MNMAWDRFRKTGRGDNVSVHFYTGMPSMFSVKKYSDALDALRLSRGIHASFQHNLASISVGTRSATFSTPSGPIETDYALLHVTPQMGPLDVDRKSTRLNSSHSGESRMPSSA